jgi:hypothetical protein
MSFKSGLLNLPGLSNKQRLFAYATTKRVGM